MFSDKYFTHPEEHGELKILVYQQSQETSHREEGEAMAQTMAEFLIEQGKKEGEKRGELRAKKEAVLKLLHIKFDRVPEVIINKITAIRSIPRLDTLFENIATATTYDEINMENNKG